MAREVDYHHRAQLGRRLEEAADQVGVIPNDRNRMGLILDSILPRTRQARLKTDCKRAIRLRSDDIRS